MLIKKRNRNKPFYRQFLKLRDNIQNRKKVIYFYKEKWQRFVLTYLKKLKQYKKFKPKDQNCYLASKYTNKWSSYKRRYKRTLMDYKRLNLLYGGLAKKLVKVLIKKTLRKNSRRVNSIFLKLFESRLDVVLYRAKFSQSIKTARQLILHGKIFVNGKLIRIKSYKLKTGDLISVEHTNFKLIKSNKKKCFIWPVPPKHLTINFRTCQIAFGTFDYTNISFNFFSHLNLEKILMNYYQY